MKKILIINCSLFIILCLSSCGVYKKYKSEGQAPDNLFGIQQLDSIDLTADNPAEISWREFFTDPLLQDLIDSALVRNTDMKSAQVSLLQAQAALRAAKLAYLPSLSLSPQGAIAGTYGISSGMSGASYTSVSLSRSTGI